jgi:hypothetical protein
VGGFGKGQERWRNVQVLTEQQAKCSPRLDELVSIFVEAKALGTGSLIRRKEFFQFWYAGEVLVERDSPDVDLIRRQIGKRL